MRIDVIKGTVKELGPGVVDSTNRHASVDYSYVELSDGRMLRNVSVVGGLDGKLNVAVEDGGEVQLHMLAGGKKADVLFAITGSDGRTYASDVTQGKAVMYALIAAVTVLGIGTIPFFGLGLVFLWFAWRMWTGVRGVLKAGDHLRTLGPVITL